MSTENALFVEYLHPGIVFGDTSSQRIASEAGISVPESAVGYRTFRRTITVEPDVRVTYEGPARSVEEHPEEPSDG